MKKPIDPNLNGFSDDDFFQPIKDNIEKSISKMSENNKTDIETEFHIQEGKLNRTHGSGSHYHSSSHHHHSSSHHHHGSSSHSGSRRHSSSHHHHGHHHRSSKKKLPLAVRIIIILLILVFLFVSIVGGTFLYLQQSGKKDLIVEQVNPEYEERIEYNGHTYIYNNNKIAFAFLGIDRENLSLNNTIGAAGQADTDVVIVIDANTGKVSLISIPRDTMVDIDLFSVTGDFVGTEKKQLCLAYAYGDGGARSCENVTSAISRILYNVPIEKYFALDLEGIAPLNDAIGGVTVESLYDFKTEGIKMGDSVKIMGDFAETYVRRRDADNIEASLNRTKRQAQYIQAYVQQLRPAVVQDFSVISRLYNTAMDYSQTNISLNDVTYIASLVLSKGISDYTQYTIEGEMRASEEVNDVVFAEFYADENSVLETVLNCFYTQVN